MEHLSKVSLDSKKIAGNLDTGLLKILALLFMLCDHIGVIFFPGQIIFRVLGRIAFPLYCWCLVVGATYSKNLPRYALRLLGVGLLSQPLYMNALSHSFKELNIFFTLLLGLVGIWGIQKQKVGSHIWLPILCLLLASSTNIYTVDYGWKGVLFILLLYLAKEHKGGLVAFWIAYSLFWGSNSASLSIPLSPFLNVLGLQSLFSSFFKLQGMVILALPLVVFPTCSALKLPKWIGYSLYPLHLALLWFLRSLLT